MASLSIYETRRLVLPIDMLVEAVLQFDRDSGGTLWQGTILDATIVAGAAPCLTLTIEPRGTTVSEQRSFTLPAIAAAFIHYCRQMKIPMPRTGKKALEVVPEGLAFCIQNTISMPRLHSNWQQTARQIRPAASAPTATADAISA